MAFFPVHRPCFLRVLPLLSMGCMIALALWSCEDEKKEVISGDIDPEQFATMTTTDVSTLISDSGVTRYRIEAPLWLVFDEAKEPRWNFPQGLMLEKFNDLFQVDASVACDSAVYFKNKQLWRLDGYVEIQNMAGEKFLTPQLYWDQRHQKIYSDSFIHIERDKKIIEGYGFESNEQMTRYHVLKVSAIFPASQFRGGDDDDDDTATAAVADSVGTVQGQVRTAPQRRSERNAEARQQMSSDQAVPALRSPMPDGGPKRIAPGMNRKMEMLQASPVEKNNNRK